MAGDGAEGGEFRSRKGDFEGATRFWIGEGFQSGKGRVRWYGDFATEKREIGHIWRISKMLGERKLTRCERSGVLSTEVAHEEPEAMN